MIGTCPKEKHIERVDIVSCFHTGLPGVYSSGGLEFSWDSWVLCEISGTPGNPVHYAICTDFRSQNGLGRTGEAQRVTVTRWNPTYEDDYHAKNVRVDQLYYWKPVQVIVPRKKDGEP